MEDMNLFMDGHDGRRWRLRQQLLSGGLEEMRSQDLMEFLVSYCVPRQDTGAVARALLNHFGDVRHVMRATLPELRRVNGVGEQTAVWISKLGEIAGMCAWTRACNTLLLDNYARVFRYALRLGRYVRPPATVQLLVDMDSHLLYRRCVAPSLSWGEPETLRDALGDVCASKAQGAILLLYADYPALDVDEYDIRCAKTYAFALHAAGSSLLDVITIGTDGLISLRSRDFIPDHSKRGLRRTLREDYLQGMPDPEALRRQDFMED